MYLSGCNPHFDLGLMLKVRSALCAHYNKYQHTHTYTQLNSQYIEYSTAPMWVNGFRIIINLAFALVRCTQSDIRKVFCWMLRSIVGGVELLINANLILSVICLNHEASANMEINACEPALGVVRVILILQVKSMQCEIHRCIGHVL